MAIILIFAGDIEVNRGPRFQCGFCKKYCNASDRVVECEDCKKRFHSLCSKIGVKDLETFEAGNTLGIVETVKHIVVFAASWF